MGRGRPRPPRPGHRSGEGGLVGSRRPPVLEAGQSRSSAHGRQRIMTGSVDGLLHPSADGAAAPHAESLADLIECHHEPAACEASSVEPPLRELLQQACHSDAFARARLVNVTTVARRSAGWVHVPKSPESSKASTSRVTSRGMARLPLGHRSQLAQPPDDLGRLRVGVRTSRAMGDRRSTTDE